MEDFEISRLLDVLFRAPFWVIVIIVFELLHEPAPYRKLVIMQRKLLPIELQMCYVLYYAIVHCPMDTSFVFICKFILAFLIACICVILEILL